MPNETIIIKGDFKKMKKVENKYIIISQSTSGISVEFMNASDDKQLLSWIGCEENSLDYEDLEQYSEYLSGFKKPYDKLDEKDFIKSIDNTKHNIKQIIEVNSERMIYRSKN